MTIDDVCATVDASCIGISQSAFLSVASEQIIDDNMQWQMVVLTGEYQNRPKSISCVRAQVDWTESDGRSFYWRTALVVNAVFLHWKQQNTHRGVCCRQPKVFNHQHYPNLRLANIRIQNEYSLLQFTIEYDCWLNSCKENFAGGLKSYSQYNELWTELNWTNWHSWTPCSVNSPIGTHASRTRVQFSSHVVNEPLHLHGTLNKLGVGLVVSS